MNEQPPSKEQSDTPRTDAAQGAWEYMGDRWVLASFAQQLEREVNQLKRYIARTAVEGGRTVAGSDIRALVESAYKDGYGGDLTDDRDLSARTLEMMRRMSRELAIPHRMRIAFQPQGRCLWHEDCVKASSGVMREVEHEESRSLLECLHCGQRGYYPKGAVGSVCVDVVGYSPQPPGDGA